MIAIIEKIQIDAKDNMKILQVGYTSDSNLINEINKNYDSTLGKFIAENRTDLENNNLKISVFFENISEVFEARNLTEKIDENTLNEITNINQL